MQNTNYTLLKLHIALSVVGFMFLLVFPFQTTFGSTEAVNNSLVGPESETGKAIKVQYSQESKIKHPAEIAKNIIYVINGMIGIVFVILLTYGGFIWMTAAGDSKKSDKALDLIQQSIIGLIIIIATWTLAWFIIEKLGQAIFGDSSG